MISGNDVLGFMTAEDPVKALEEHLKHQKYQKVTAEAQDAWEHQRRRELFALRAYQALLPVAPKNATYADVAGHAVIAADALLAALDKKATP